VAAKVYLRVRGDEPVEFPAELSPLAGQYAGGSLITTTEEIAEPLLATGLVEKVDTNFVAIRMQEGQHWPGLDMSNNRIVGVVENTVPAWVEADTDAEFKLLQIASALSESPISENEFRAALREDPVLSVYADAEFPPLRFYVGLDEAVALVVRGFADPIHADELDDALE
jgi:hypothetical protein